MADGTSRFEAKQELRSSGERIWTFSTGRIHSFVTRTVYQRHILRFINWARQEHSINRLERLDERADELSTLYLTHHIAANYSPYTIQAERAALRMFFGNRNLAAAVTLPTRRREDITRSRKAVMHDRHFQAANWQPMIRFLQACGLRRAEVRDLRIGDIHQSHDGSILVHVKNGKGGRPREVPVLPGHEQDVLQVMPERKADEKVFDHIPKHMDVHALRREYAQALYMHHAPSRTLPPTKGRLKRTDYDRNAAEQVTWALGHNRIDVVLRHYLR